MPLVGALKQLIRHFGEAATPDNCGVLCKDFNNQVNPNGTPEIAPKYEPYQYPLPEGTYII